MTQLNGPEVQYALSLRKRVTELESLLHTLLDQINTHQVYDKEARVLIQQALNSPNAVSAALQPEGLPAPRRATEFPSFFPCATSSPNFV